MSDTDSFLYHVQTDDLYLDMVLFLFCVALCFYYGAFHVGSSLALCSCVF